MCRNNEKTTPRLSELSRRINDELQQATPIDTPIIRDILTATPTPAERAKKEEQNKRLKEFTVDIG